jgi:hypothetical protein
VSAILSGHEATDLKVGKAGRACDGWTNMLASLYFQQLIILDGPQDRLVSNKFHNIKAHYTTLIQAGQRREKGPGPWKQSYKDIYTMDISRLNGASAGEC